MKRYERIELLGRAFAYGEIDAAYHGFRIISEGDVPANYLLHFRLRVMQTPKSVPFSLRHDKIITFYARFVNGGCVIFAFSQKPQKGILFQKNTDEVRNHPNFL